MYNHTSASGAVHEAGHAVAAERSDRRGSETDFQLIRRYVKGKAVSLPDARAYARREARRILTANWEQIGGKTVRGTPVPW
jgi:hypothetical protein